MKTMMDSPFRWKSMAMMLLLAAVFGYASAQEVSVQIQSSKSRYLIGEHAPVFIRANADRMVQIKWPDLPDTIAGGLRILKKGPVDTITDPDGISHYQMTFIVSAYDTGRFVIQPISITYQPFGAREIREASTSHLTLFFGSIPVDEQSEIRGIKGPMAIGWSVAEITLMVLSVLLFLLFAWLLIRFFRSKRDAAARPSERVATDAPRTPWELALEALEALRESPLLESGDTKQYWVELSGVLREYIHAGLGINAPELTTRQTLRRLSTHNMLTPDLLAKITELLQLADMVKFAKALPDADKSLAMTDQAAEFIAGTAPAHVNKETGREVRQ
jgi:hypothetical protein